MPGTGGRTAPPRWGPPIRQGGPVPPGAPARPGAPGRQGPSGPGPAGPGVRPPATGRPGGSPTPGPLAALAPSAPAKGPTGAPGATEALLREILVEILGRPDVPRDGNFFDDLGADSLLMARFCARIRKHPDLPSAAMQDIYQHPTLAKLSVALAPTPKKSDASGAARTTSGLGAVLAEILERPDVPPHANFFEELGADSLLMARFCARTRKRDDLPSVGMPDVYRNPTIASLTAALDGGADPDRVRSGPAGPPATESEEPTGPRATTAAFVLCGAAQLTLVLAYSYIAALILTWGFQAVTAATGLVAGYVAALLAGVIGFVTLSVVPIAAKWALIGRWQPGSIRVWSPAYLRFWVVKTLVRASPMVLFAGTPAFTLYLRALGAKVGRDVVYLSSQVPVCTDLFSIGDGSLVRKESVVACYRAHDGRIEIGGVSIGAGAFVGEATVLDVRTAVGDGASLAHSSSLHAGQAIPAGEVWHGSPGRRADGPLPAVPPAPGSRSRRALYSTVLGVFVLAVASPAALVIAGALYSLVPQFAALLAPAPGVLATVGFHVDLLALSALLYFGALVLGLIVSTTVPRLFALGVRPDVVYPLYGIRYWLHRSIGALTNVKAFVELFGDSSAIAHYLAFIGYRLRPIEQTGSNFGMAVAHENPFLTSVGRGTVVADGLSVMNAEYSATSFRVSRTAIGANNFLGNKIAYPPQGRTGDDCLLATKVAVPLHGPVRQGVGLLGSPSFEIPRTVARDSALDVADPQELAALLRRKNRHNGVSMALHLLVRWFFLYLTLVSIAVVASLPIEAGPGEVVLAELVGLVVLVGWFVLVERVFSPLKSLAPQGCSIYDPAFLRHERYWKVPAPDWVQLFNGTPFKPLVWRLLGVHVGARVFDDGVNLTEKAFTTIGDDATLGEGCVVQCHSQEDGGFKSDHVVIGNRVTLGVSSFVHYGTTIGDDAILAPDTFLMKGEEVPPAESWGGNPARGSD
ncbi:Pls/PosA family non-ribosomal peptide synthetase [Actinomycetospora sp. CA-053990]|uniref:Pls/PosA family non-ribosomal peptide synthetase n=1 Tax=Actinomycetospora sp. CA-053990 TaxID=3239891 RepID=UPI003D91CE5B